MVKLLVVDDSQDAIDVADLILTDQGYDFDVAMEAESGIELAKKSNYDLIILDYMLPGKSGYDVLKEIREGGVESPVIMASAYDKSDSDMAGKPYQPDGYMTKPFGPDDFIARIHAYIHSHYASAEGNIKITPSLQHNEEQHVFFFQGSVVPLTKVEYSILALLVKQKGKVVPKEEIWQHVYGNDKPFEPPLFDAIITKLDENLTTSCPGEPLLRHDIGLGITFIAG